MYLDVTTNCLPVSQAVCTFRLKAEDLVFQLGKSPRSGVTNLSKVDPIHQLYIPVIGRSDSLHSGHHGWGTTHQDLLLSDRFGRHMIFNHFLGNESSTIRPISRGFVEDIVNDESTIRLIPEFLQFFP
jgi:hypothetical protein